MKKLWLGTLTALTLLASTGAPPIASASAPVVLVDARDAKNDVKHLDNQFTPAQRASIDIRRVTISQQGSKVRFAVKLKAITSSKKFDQMVFIRLIPKGASTESGDIGFSPQSRDLGYANLTDDTTFDIIAVCDPLTAKAKPAMKLTFLDVPASCVPDGKVKVKVLTLTGIFRSDAPVHSKDVFRMPGRHDLQP
jgi:hypothetical protein